MLKKIALIPVKILLVPLLLITGTVSVLLNLATHLSFHVIGPFMLFLLGSGVYTVIKHLWSQTFLLGGMAVACVGLLMGAAFIQDGLDRIQGLFLDVLYQ